MAALHYTYEVVELVPGREAVLRTSEGPLPTETTYEWVDADGGRTGMTLRKRGTPSGLSGCLAPFMAGGPRANVNDLDGLKRRLAVADEEAGDDKARRSRRSRTDLDLVALHDVARLSPSAVPRPTASAGFPAGSGATQSRGVKKGSKSMGVLGEREGARPASPGAAR